LTSASYCQNRFSDSQKSAFLAVFLEIHRSRGFLEVFRDKALKGGEMARDAGVSLKVRGTSQKALAGCEVS